MKIKLLFITLFLLPFMSCGSEVNNPISHKSSEGVEYKIEMIDGCEYITSENGVNGMNNYSFSRCHKGDCKNPIHEYRKVGK